MSKKRVEAVAYLRTSSATNVGADKDGDKRQRDAIHVFAKRAGYVIVDEFYDATVKDADPVQERPGFAALLERIRDNGVRTIIVETANRFARDLIVQATGHRMLKAQGIEISPPTVRAPLSRTRRQRPWSVRCSAPWRSSTRR